MKKILFIILFATCFYCKDKVWPIHLFSKTHEYRVFLTINDKYACDSCWVRKQTKLNNYKINCYIGHGLRVDKVNKK